LFHQFLKELHVRNVTFLTKVDSRFKIFLSFYIDCIGNNYRFVAAAFSKSEFRPTAIAAVILGGLPAVFIGPELSQVCG
jgi:hypothetical protein